MVRVFFDRFSALIQAEGPAAIKMHNTVLGKDNFGYLRYIPFEHVNVDARLVIVGITPGPNQLRLAYAEARRLLCLGQSKEKVLKAVKDVAAFGDITMRPNLLRMLSHFRFRDIFAVGAEEDFWSSHTEVIHSTSVIPHAAFDRKDRPFNGNFAKIQRSDSLRTSFQEDFLPSLSLINRDAVYLALGPTPLEALNWCVQYGLIKSEQVLGAFPHPATTGGSQVTYYLRERTKERLAPRDPVRHRTDWLDTAYAGMRVSVDRLLSSRTNDDGLEVMVGRVQPWRTGDEKDSILQNNVFPDSRRDAVLVNLTGGNLRNSHISLRGAVHILPADSIGGRNKEFVAPKLLTVEFKPGRIVQTDVDGQKMIFRERGAVRDFFLRSAAAEGDQVLIRRTGYAILEISVCRPAANP